MSTARLLGLSLLLALMIANLLLGARTMDGASDDLFPPWVLARLAVTGHRADSYDIATQFALFDDQSLPGFRWMLRDMPQIRGIGLCPYPPTAVVVYAPLALLSYDAAGMVVYFGSIVLAIVTAGLISQLTARRIGMMTAIVAILYYPGFLDTLRLGQNGPLTLMLLVFGWRSVVRGHDIAAGLWWGLLAYKPQWLLAVGWLPLALGRPRIWIGMAAPAILLAVAATIWLGPEVWTRWLDQVAAVDHVYATDAEFRQYLLPQGCDARSVLNRSFIPTVGRPLGWAAIAVVMAVTTIWYRRQPGEGASGPKAPALLFACGLTVPHLYYYDEMVFLLPLLLLWSHRANLERWQVIVLIALTAGFYLAIPYAGWYCGFHAWPAPTAAVVALWLFSLFAFGDASPKK
jgi:Glycosyltransferase family 87